MQVGYKLVNTTEGNL